MKINNNYTIIAKCVETGDSIVLAGFCANENGEQLMSQHLLNICKQCNGGFVNAKNLLVNAMADWQQYFGISTLQLLHTAIHTQHWHICNISLYKNQNNSIEKLVNTFYL